jgi:hypothetical protein
MIDSTTVERALRAKWGKVPGLYRIAVRFYGSSWAVMLAGPGARAPQGIPPSVTVDLGAFKSTKIPVYWEQVPQAAPRQIPWAPNPQSMKRANAEMWGGAPEVTDRPMAILDPRGNYGVRTLEQRTKAPYREYQLAGNVRTPELPFWSLPFDLQQCGCFSTFNIDQTIFTYQVPSDEQLTLRGICYSASGIPAGNYIQVRVDRSGDTQAQWQDIMMQPTGDPAFQFAFTGYENPMPFNLLVDHDQSINVTVRLLGIPPFTISPGYPTQAQICLMLRGWTSKLNDRRTGWPRPQDLGDINDAAQGYDDIIGRFHNGALVDAVQQVLSAEDYEVQHPEQGGGR